MLQCTSTECATAGESLGCDVPSKMRLRRLADASDWRGRWADNLFVAQSWYQQLALHSAVAEALVVVPATASTLRAAGTQLDANRLGGTTEIDTAITNLREMVVWRSGKGITSVIPVPSGGVSPIATLKKWVDGGCGGLAGRDGLVKQWSSAAEDEKASVEALLKDRLEKAAVDLSSMLNELKTFGFFASGSTVLDSRPLRAVVKSAVEALNPFKAEALPEEASDNDELTIAARRLRKIESGLRQALGVGDDAWLLAKVQEMAHDAGVPQAQKGQLGFRVLHGGENVLLFDSRLQKAYRSDSGLRGMHHSPATIITLLDLVPDMHLHVAKLRSWVGKFMMTHGLELPILLDKLQLERQAWATDIVASAEAQGWDTMGGVRACAEAAMKGPLRVMKSSRSSLCVGTTCYKFQQVCCGSAAHCWLPLHTVGCSAAPPVTASLTTPLLTASQSTGRSADRGTSPEHSIAQCFPPALAGAVQVRKRTRFFCRRFCARNDRFTKTGSGQTHGKLKHRGAFS